MRDPRSQHLRKLRRLRGSAQRWSVLSGGLGGAAAILTPYQGIGPLDAIWVGAAGAAGALALWRLSDLRSLAAQPVPDPPDPAVAARRTQARLLAAVRRLPAGQAALAEVRKRHARFGLRRSAAAGPWTRLDRAAETLSAVSGRLGGSAEVAILEAAVAERGLRDTAHRVASVERALRFAPPDARGTLQEAHRALVAQLTEGVAAYERLVAAAAGVLAEDGRLVTDHSATTRLVEAAELLRQVAAGLAELRAATSAVLRA